MLESLHVYIIKLIFGWNLIFCFISYMLASTGQPRFDPVNQNPFKICNKKAILIPPFVILIMFECIEMPWFGSYFT